MNGKVFVFSKQPLTLIGTGRSIGTWTGTGTSCDRNEEIIILRIFWGMKGFRLFYGVERHVTFTTLNGTDLVIVTGYGFGICTGTGRSMYTLFFTCTILSTGYGWLTTMGTLNGTWILNGLKEKKKDLFSIFQEQKWRQLQFFKQVGSTNRYEL